MSTPLEEVLTRLDGQPEQSHRRAVSSGPGGARLLGGHGGMPRRVITLNHNDTVGDALHTLARHRILSAPVVIQPDVLNADGIHHERCMGEDDRLPAPTLLGFFDVTDALRCLVSELPPEERKMSTAPPHRNVLSWMKVLERVERRVMSKRLITVLGDDADLMFRPNAANHSLLDIVREGFLDRNTAKGTSVHRLAMFNPKGETERVFSMTDAVRFLALEANNLGGLADMNLREIGFVAHLKVQCDVADKAPPVTVGPTVPAIEVFAEMQKKGVSGLGIVDDSGGLIANLSASDLRGIEPEHFGVLGLPVAEFLALLHATSYAGFSHVESQNRTNPFFAKMNEGGFRRAGPFLIVARPDDSLRRVLQEITEHGVHRVYVCQADSMEPVGVITLTDILRLVCDAAEASRGEDAGNREDQGGAAA